MRGHDHHHHAFRRGWRGIGRGHDYDLVLLDLGPPDLPGHDVLRRLRRSQVQTPVLILSGDDATDTKLMSFGLGADDYLTKPFQHNELLARIQAIVRRTRAHAQPTRQLGRPRLNLDEKTAAVGGYKLPLTGKEYQVLELLAVRRGKTISKDVFLNHLYGGLDEPEAKIIDVFICKLHRKLAAALGHDHDTYIETVWGRGYASRETKLGAQSSQASAA